MMRLTLTLSSHFRRQWSKLPAPAQAQVARALEKLHHGTGKRKAIVTRPGTFEIRAAGDLRVLWQYAGVGRIEVQSVVNHDGI